MCYLILISALVGQVVAQSTDSIREPTGFKDLVLGSSIIPHLTNLDLVMTPFEGMQIFQRRNHLEPDSQKYAHLGHYQIAAMEVFAYQDTIQEIRVFLPRDSYNELLAILKQVYGSPDQDLDTLILEEQKAQRLACTWENIHTMMWFYAIDQEGSSQSILGFRDKRRFQSMRLKLKADAQKDLFDRD